MANDAVQPYNGPVTLDLQPIASIIVDLKPGQMQFLRSEKEGMAGVILELNENMPAVGTKATISSDVYAHLIESNDRLGKIRAVKPLVAKLFEVLDESEAYYEDQCETDISVICDAVRSAARRKDESLLASFERTLKYNSQSAEKAVRTRRKNAKTEAKAEAKPASEPPESPEASPPAG